MDFLRVGMFIVLCIATALVAQQCYQSDTREAREKAQMCLQSHSVEVCAAYCTAEFRSGGYMAGHCMREVIQ